MNSRDGCHNDGIDGQRYCAVGAGDGLACERTQPVHRVSHSVIVAVSMAVIASGAMRILVVVVPLTVGMLMFFGRGSCDSLLPADSRRVRGVRPGESRAVQGAHQMDADQQYQPEQESRPRRACPRSTAARHTIHTLNVVDQMRNVTSACIGTAPEGEG
ncbi:hypothetical protein [Streptomyces hygroscopicus]|uniref:hypothetical protein n=1 Tax=Streptomyces hygroscopicus TaxID=1912 RepID=UPI001FCC0792|nr:hypothetical protein [Streptomyces hygroscopicus]BDH12801.1 hypothetical protein HOK021_39800 [Streptomyces hygroscopicus]